MSAATQARLDAGECAMTAALRLGHLSTPDEIIDEARNARMYGLRPIMNGEERHVAEV